MRLSNTEVKVTYGIQNYGYKKYKLLWNTKIKITYAQFAES